MSKEIKPDRRIFYIVLAALIFGVYKLHGYLTGIPFTFEWRDGTMLLPFTFLVGGLALAYLLSKFAAKPKKCLVCSIDTHDSYMDESDKLLPICRKHLIEKWRVAFLVSSFNMMVLEPDFENYPGAYSYASTKRLVKEWNYQKKDAINIDRIIALIPGKICESCNKPASVAFFRKNEYKWPFFSKIDAEPTFYCKACTALKIEPLVISSKEAFSEGLYAPRAEEGIYHVQEF